MIAPVLAEENLEQIRTIPSFNTVSVGPNDFTNMMWIPNGVDRPDLIAMLQRIINVAKLHGCRIGLRVRQILQGGTDDQ